MSAMKVKPCPPERVLCWCMGGPTKSGGCIDSMPLGSNEARSTCEFFAEWQKPDQCWPNGGRYRSDIEGAS